MKRGQVSRSSRANLRRWVRPALVALFGFSVIGLLFSIVTQSPSGSPSRPLLMVTSDWEPYVSSEGTEGGPVARLVSEVLGRAGYSADLTFTSWAQVDRQVTHGAAAAAFPVIASAERREHYLVSDPLTTFEYTLFYNSGAGPSPRVDTGKDLASLRIGTIAGYDYWDEFDENAHDVHEYDDSLAAFEGLDRGEVDVVAEGLVSGEATIHSAAFSGSSADFAPLAGESDFTRSRESLHLVAARTVAGRELIERFNTELRDYKSSGEYDELVASIDAPAPSRVVLTSSNARSTLIQLTDHSGTAQAVTPAGTTAIVLHWPEDTAKAAAASNRRIRVKLTSGPESGRILFVAYRFIELLGEQD